MNGGVGLNLWGGDWSGSWFSGLVSLFLLKFSVVPIGRGVGLDWLLALLGESLRLLVELVISLIIDIMYLGLD